MGCFCEIFENETLWLIILTLLIIYLICGHSDCGVTYRQNGCGCGCN